MGLSRLDNFLKSVRGTILYVDPSSIDATDNIENQGNSLTRPFRTVQRALIEASRFSYQRGFNNDRFNKTTILLYPGDHTIDNRPGWIPDGASNFRLRSGETSADLTAFDLDTNFDLTAANNALYKFNSIHGGVIIPRGTSIVGMDLRKTRIRPSYVPNPANDDIERSALFRVTGGCYLWQFTILDADPNGICYKDYTTNTFVPNFSHHKLTGFEYADGVNNVSIDDIYQTYSTDRTDLDMYYEKISIAYGTASGRPIFNPYPSASEDIQPVVDEYRIVGSRGAEVGITSIKSGDGATGSVIITVDLDQEFNSLNVDTPIQISGITDAGYNGQYVVYRSLSSTQIQYKVQTIPSNPLPNPTGSTLSIAVDTVTSASPYIFNCSLRSVYGMCGLLADGSKANGFKSMVVAQYTGIGLQKDDNAFVKYDSATGQYDDSTTITNLHTNSLSIFKPTYENFHIKATNSAYVQIVSVFAIGYAQHFSVESGGDFSINNSNSNFGAKSLVASGFRKEAFPKDDCGYITHIISPKENQEDQRSVEFLSIDTTKTVGIGSTHRLYLYNETNQGVAPINVVNGYRIGAKPRDTLYVQLNQSGVTTEYSARIIMPDTQYSGSETSFEKSFIVGRSVTGINSITSNIATLTSKHSFIQGETVRVISDNGHLPDGIEPNQVYYAITSGISSNQVQFAQTLNDAINQNAITINAKGGVLNIVSRVSDKNSGDIGHPVGFDTANSNWYINVATASSENSIYSRLASFTGTSTPKTYVKRTPDTRNLIDTTYRVRYVIPKDAPIAARPPLDGYVIQETNNTIGSTDAEIQKYFSTSPATLTNTSELKNPRFVANATWSSSTANIITELPHDLTVGSEVEVINVKSTSNPVGVANSFFNGTFTVTGISSSKQFSYDLTSNPGTFTNDTGTRDTNLPYFKRKKLKNSYQIYRSTEIQKYVENAQDGIYHLLLINSSSSPTVSPFTELKLPQPVENLYPQVNRDNLISDPESSKCFAVPDPIGKVIINEPQNSLTKETIEKQFIDFNVGVPIIDIKSGAATTHTVYTGIDHGLCGITSVSILNGGSGYTAGTYYNARIASSTTGANATAKVIVGGAGTVTSVQIMDGGSAYKVGDAVALSGIGSVGSSASVTVTNIYNNIGDCLSISGVSSTSYAGYNNLYRIADVSSSQQIYVTSSEAINNTSASGVGVTLTANANVVNVGQVLGISTISYDASSGISTITFASAHGFKLGNKLKIGGADSSFFNGSFIVENVISNNILTINPGVSTSAPSVAGPIQVYRYNLSSQGGDVSRVNENTSGRLSYQYAGITTTLATTVLSTASESNPLIITNAATLGLNIGDYLLIGDEIFRIKTTVSGSSVYAFRAIFGTNRQTHSTGALVRKIKPQPIELRRNSIIRASAHTFEYMGYGPGNYSTAFPEKQDRVISSQEQLLAQASKIDGGVTIYTGMDDKGNFYTGNKKISSTTGQEEVYDSPIPTVTGEDLSLGSINVGFNVLTPLEVSVDRSIRVGGGEDRNIISQFDGPVIFNNKITSNSSEGIETKSLLLKGDADVSREITIGIGSTPTTAGNPGDVIQKAFPEHNKYMGWIYTVENQWEPFGFIGTLPNGLVFGTANQVLYKNNLAANSGNPEFLFQDNSTLIIGTASSTGINNQKLQISGGTYISGSVGIGKSNPSNALDVVGVVTATSYRGSGINLTGIVTSLTAGSGISLSGSTGNVTVTASGDASQWSKNSVGVSTVSNVGVGTTNPVATLTVTNGSSSSVDAALARFLTPNLNTSATTSIAIGKTFSNYQSVLLSYNYNGNSASSGSYFTISHTGQGNTLVIADNDRVGVGIANPTAKLDVNGTANFSGSVTLNGGGGGVALQLNSGGDLQFWNSSNTGSALLYCDTSSQLKTNGSISADGGFAGNLTGNVTGNVSGSSGSCSGNAASVTNGVYTTGNQTIGGTKTFSSTISGSIDGNANYANSSGTSGSCSGNSATATALTGSAITSSTEQPFAAAGNTFTGIPSWAKRITIMFDQLSVNSTQDILIRLNGQSSGYLSSSLICFSTGNSGRGTPYTTGFGIVLTGAAQIYTGHMVITKMSGNKWVSNHVLGLVSSGIGALHGGGTVTLSGDLSNLSILPASGAIDGGSFNIMYE